MLSHCTFKLIALLSVIGIAWTTTITTTNGTIQGGKCEDYDVNYFWAIPYAKPPVGDLRFAAPEPYDKKYDGAMLKATSPAPRCIQFGTAFVEPGPSSEDCLFIDIWAPANASKDSKLPVKVWLFGGSNQAGSISNGLYDGCPSAKDSLVVSINYRLGPLGFLAYPDAGVAGNFAIRDQLLALSWIQTEIASFGGDPNKVMLFGQSAGAVDAYVIASLAQASSLFHAVAMESGGGRDSPDIEWTKPFYSKYIHALGCNPDGSDVLDCLRKVSVTNMNNTLLVQDRNPGNSVSASTPISDHGEGNAWTAVVDGNVVPENPGKVGVRVPAIFGSAVMDGSFFVLLRYRTAVETISEADYNEFLSVSFGPLATKVEKFYPWSDFEAYSPYQGLIAMTTVYTAVSYKCPAQRGLRAAAAKGIDAWAYSFNHTNSCPWYSGMPDKRVELMAFGPTHTSEIPFIFGQTKNLPRPDGSCNFTEAEDAISDFMIDAWTSMAASARPANSSVWPAWTPDKSEGITIYDGVSAGYLNMTECDFWDQIIDGFAKVDASEAAAANASTSPGTSGSSTAWNASGRVACLFILLAVFFT